MADLRFTWNPAKAAENLRKHGVSFVEAQTAFEDGRGLVIDDPDHSDDDDRFILLGSAAWPASWWSSTATVPEATLFA